MKPPQSEDFTEPVDLDDTGDQLAEPVRAQVLRESPRVEIGVNGYVVTEAFRYRQHGLDLNPLDGPIADRPSLAAANRLQHIIVVESVKALRDLRLLLDEREAEEVVYDHQVTPQLRHNAVDRSSLVGDRQGTYQKREVRVGRGSDEQAGGLVAVLVRVRPKPGPRTAAAAQRSRRDFVRLGHRARLPAATADPQVGQFARRARLVERQLTKALRGAIVRKLVPRKVVDMALRAGPHEACSDDPLVREPPFFVQRLSVDKSAGPGFPGRGLVPTPASGILHDKPFGEAVGVDPLGKAQPILGRIGSWRDEEVRVGNPGHAGKGALNPGFIESLQRLRPAIHAGNNGRVARKVDQRTRAVGRDDLTATNLAGGTGIHFDPRVSLRSLT